jgi:hypothetical protein
MSRKNKGAKDIESLYRLAKEGCGAQEWQYIVGEFKTFINVNV